MDAHLKFFLAVIAGALLLMAAAFYNGYPIFFSDSHIYLLTAFESFVPADHAAAYGYFIYIASLFGFSLWTVIFFQCLILSWLILLSVKFLLGKNLFILRSLFILFFLSFFTGISWTASQVMADVFAPVAFFSFFLIVFYRIPLLQLILLYAVFMLSVSMHFSHILLFFILLIVVLLARKRLFSQLEQKRALSHILILLSITLIEYMPMRHAMNNSKYVIFMGAMAEQDITRQYLNEYCPTHNYMLCKYKDSLPATGSAFLFNPGSPVNIIGRNSPELNKECKEITIGTLTKPKYIGLHIIASIEATVKQFCSFDIGDGNWSFTDSTGIIYNQILKHVKNEAKPYFISRQSRVNFSGINTFKIISRAFELISALFITGLFIFRRNIFTLVFRNTVLIFLLMVIINDWDLSTFSTVTNRFGCKVAWMIPFLAILGLFRLIDSFKRDMDAPEQLHQ